MLCVWWKDSMTQIRHEYKGAIVLAISDQQSFESDTPSDVEWSWMIVAKENKGRTVNIPFMSNIAHFLHLLPVNTVDSFLRIHTT